MAWNLFEQGLQPFEIKSTNMNTNPNNIQVIAPQTIIKFIRPWKRGPWTWTMTGYFSLKNQHLYPFKCFDDWQFVYQELEYNAVNGEDFNLKFAVFYLRV